MASIDCISFSNQDCRFKCDFCSSTFETEEHFNGHVLEHFDSKNCLACNKFVIRIGSKWYELHASNLSGNEFEDRKDDFMLNAIAEVKVEECDDEKLEFDDSNDADIRASDNIDLDFGSENDLDSDFSEKAEEQISNKKRKNQTKGKKDGGKKIKLNEDNTNKQAEADNTPKVERSRSKRKGRLARIKCRICDRIILQYNFDIHLQKMHVPRIIVPNEPIKCETCGKKFANAGNLKTHQAIHSGTKRFVCNYCGTSFRQLYHLTEHINAHTADKPYHCTVCDKRFGRLHILRSHQRVHTGEMPYKCSIDDCDRAYAYDIDLKRHKFSAHGIYTKKHICSFCSKVFPENKLLKKHLESHSAGNIRRLVTQSDG